MKYVTEFGIVPYIKRILEKEYQNESFTFKFDETSTNQSKKQYDGHVTYFSKKINRNVTLYCGFTLVGHCTSKDLRTHVFEFITNLKLNVDYLLNIGTDGAAKTSEY